MTCGFFLTVKSIQPDPNAHVTCSHRLGLGWKAFDTVSIQHIQPIHPYFGR